MGVEVRRVPSEIDLKRGLSLYSEDDVHIRSGLLETVVHGEDIVAFAYLPARSQNLDIAQRFTHP